MIFLFVYLINADKLIYVIEYGRHGARNPEIETPWNNDPMGLTAAGMRQQYLLGHAIRDHYKDYLDLQYNPKQFRVQSSYKARTLASATARVMGLYNSQPISNLKKEEAEHALPPNDFDYSDWTEELGNRKLYRQIQLVPIECEGEDNDYLLEPKIACPSVYDTKQKYMREHKKDIQEFSKQNIHLYKEMIAYLNISEDYLGVENGLKIRNVILTQLYEGLLPNNKEKEAMDLLKRTKLLYYFKKFDCYHKIAYGNYKISKVMATPFLSYVKNTLVSASKGKTNGMKYEMFVASDTLLHGILLQLGYYDVVEVPFSFILCFELYQRNSSSFYVNVLYNTTSNKKYELDEFLKFIDEITYNEEDFWYYCLAYKPPILSKSSWLLLIIGIILLIVITCLFINYLMRRKDWQPMIM